MTEYIDKDIRNKYKENSILPSYLIHVENEIMNIQMKIQTDKVLEYILSIYGISVLDVDSSLIKTLRYINGIINALKE